MYTKKPFKLSTLLLLTFMLSGISTLYAYESPLQTTIAKAETGLIDAQLEMAIAYEHGEGVTKDPQKVVNW